MGVLRKVLILLTETNRFRDGPFFPEIFEFPTLVLRSASGFGRTLIGSSGHVRFRAVSGLPDGTGDVGQRGADAADDVEDILHGIE